MVSVSWNSGRYVVHHKEVVKGALPEQIETLLMSKLGAHHFRDIKKYTVHRQNVYGNVYCEYQTGWKFLSQTVRLHIHRVPTPNIYVHRLHFRTASHAHPGFFKVSGEWKLTYIPPDTTSVELRQHITPVALPRWVPLAAVLRSRIKRVFQDITKAVS